MNVAVILPAAGLGKRFAVAAGNTSNYASKIEHDLVGKPVFLRSVELFLNRPGVKEIILAVNPDAVDEFKFRWGDKLAFLSVKIVPGGRAERWETVLKAMQAVGAECTHIAVHDAARPLTSPALLDRVFEAAKEHTAVIPGIAAASTLKLTESVTPEAKADPLDAILGGVGKPNLQLRKIVRTVDRRHVYEVQTPQMFERSLLAKAYEQITSGKLTGEAITDDAGLVEALGETVYVVEGESTNLKITRPDDLKLASAYLAMHQQQNVAKQAKKKLFADDDE